MLSWCHCNMSNTLLQCKTTLRPRRARAGCLRSGSASRSGGGGEGARLWKQPFSAVLPRRLLFEDDLGEALGWRVASEKTHRLQVGEDRFNLLLHCRQQFDLRRLPRVEAWPFVATA